MIKHKEISHEQLLIYPSLYNNQKSLNTEALEAKSRSIFVCTFCQVFSTSNAALANHIAKEHGQFLKEGTFPENYVSKLQALKKEGSSSKRIGRPRKASKKSPVINEEKNIVSKPVLGFDGFYWCKKCHKHFKKSRQLSMHICFENDIVDELLDGINTVERDNSPDYKTYMNVQPNPWFKRKKCKTKDLCSNQNLKESLKETVVEVSDEFQEETLKALPNWRDDPSYVPLFKSDDEKIEFEKHLKTIDYTEVDGLFAKIETKSNYQKKKIGISTSKYSCMICKKVFKSQSHIRMHCLIHTDLKPFTCNKCSYKTNAKGSLYSHMRSHTGNLFRCSQCNFTTTKRSHMIDHEQTHSSVLQCCELCKNTYKTLKSLTCHVKMYHNNASGRKFLKSLSSKHVNKISVKCSICEKKFTSNLTLEAHKQHDHVFIPSSRTLDSQNIIENRTENSFENTNRQDMPVMLDCCVRIEPLTDQLVSYHQYKYNCDVCDQRFLTESAVVNHKLFDHSVIEIPKQLKDEEIRAKITESSIENMNSTDPKLSSLLKCSVRLEPLDDHLVEIMLNNILNQKHTQPIELFEDVFQQSSGYLNSNHILSQNPSEEASKKLLPINELKQFDLTNSSLLEECQIDILDECLRQSNVTNEDIRKRSYQATDSDVPSERHEQLTTYLPEIELNFSNNSLMSETVPENSSLMTPGILQLETGLIESKPEEIKLFEKCRRAPAFVCCVCSGIFICPSTLKAHLKEHVNKCSGNKPVMQHSVTEFKLEKFSKKDSTLDEPCSIFQGTSNYNVDNELEKLYTSSLHKMWYLPEVSVVLENDQSLIDTVLDDISNFPLNDKFDGTTLQLECEMFS